MIIITLNSAGWFVETNIIKSRERSTFDVSNCMIRYEKMFFPAHKHVIGIFQNVVIEIIRIESICILFKSGKLTLELKNTKHHSCVELTKIFKLLKP